MRLPMIVLALTALALQGCASTEEAGQAAAPDAPVEEAAVAEAATTAPASAEETAAAGKAPAPEPMPLATRDGKEHKWELRAFKDGHVEVWMDGGRVPDDRIVRDAHRIGVTDGHGTVIERLDLPEAWSPAHGTPDPAGTYRRIDGTVLVPPASMLGGRLEPVPAAALAHLRAEHTQADGSRCAYVAFVIPGLPLDQAGVRPHDVVVAVNGSGDASPDSVRAAVRAAKPGDRLQLKVIRAGRAIDANVTLASWDPKHMVRMAGEPVRTAPAAADDTAVATAAPVTQASADDDLAAARQRIAELEAQVRKEDAVHRAIRPAPMPQPRAAGAPN